MPRILRFSRTATSREIMTTPGTYRTEKTAVFASDFKELGVREEGNVILHASPGRRAQQIPMRKAKGYCCQEGAKGAENQADERWHEQEPQPETFPSERFDPKFHMASKIEFINLSANPREFTLITLRISGD